MKYIHSRYSYSLCYYNLHINNLSTTEPTALCSQQRLDPSTGVGAQAEVEGSPLRHGGRVMAGAHLSHGAGRAGGAGTGIGAEIGIRAGIGAGAGPGGAEAAVPSPRNGGGRVCAVPPWRWRGWKEGFVPCRVPCTDHRISHVGRDPQGSSSLAPDRSNKGHCLARQSLIVFKDLNSYNRLAVLFQG